MLHYLLPFDNLLLDNTNNHAESQHQLNINDVPRNINWTTKFVSQNILNNKVPSNIANGTNALLVGSCLQLNVSRSRRHDKAPPSVDDAGISISGVPFGDEVVIQHRSRLHLFIDVVTLAAKLLDY